MTSQKTLTTTIITVTIVCLLLTLATLGVLGAPKGTGNVNTINVNLYSDPSCTIKCTSINWENIRPNSAINKTLYIKNSGNTTITLSMSTKNWNPKGANSELQLSWNLNNYRLSVEKVVPATLTLTATSNIANLTNFKFTIIITGTQ